MHGEIGIFSNGLSSVFSSTQGEFDNSYYEEYYDAEWSGDVLGGYLDEEWNTLNPLYTFGSIREFFEFANEKGENIDLAFLKSNQTIYLQGQPYIIKDLFARNWEIKFINTISGPQCRNNHGPVCTPARYYGQGKIHFGNKPNANDLNVMRGRALNSEELTLCIVFHEMMHGLGFDHEGDTDTAYIRFDRHYTKPLFDAYYEFLEMKKPKLSSLPSYQL